MESQLNSSCKHLCKPVLPKLIRQRCEDNKMSVENKGTCGSKGLAIIANQSFEVIASAQTCTAFSTMTASPLQGFFFEIFWMSGDVVSSTVHIVLEDLELFFDLSSFWRIWFPPSCLSWTYHLILPATFCWHKSRVFLNTTCSVWFASLPESYGVMRGSCSNLLISLANQQLAPRNSMTWICWAQTERCWCSNARSFWVSTVSNKRNCLWQAGNWYVTAL